MLSEFRAEPQNQSALQAWTNVFRLPQVEHHRQWISVTNKLGLILNELDHLELQMTATILSNQAYREPLMLIRQQLDPSGLANNAGHYSSFVGDYTLTILIACRDVLPSDGQPVNPDDLDTLTTLLVELTQNIDRSDLPSPIKDLVQKHIQIIHNAISDYRVRGTTAFVTGSLLAMQLAIENQDLIEQHKADPEVLQAMSSIQDVWRWVDNHVDLKKARDILAAAASGATFVEKMANLMLGSG